MGFVVDYLNSTRMAQDIAKVMGSERPEDLEYVNQQMTCALLRWQQLFENPNVPRETIQLRTPNPMDFSNYRAEVLHLFSKHNFNISEERITAQVQKLLIQSAKNMLTGKGRIEPRIVTLLTTGACEFHGFNAVFEDSIRKNGLDPKAKVYSQKDIDKMCKIISKVNVNTMGNAQRDQNKIFVTPDPSYAYMHAKASPEWFYFFSSGCMQVNFPYLNRDYKAARNNLLKFPGHEDLSSDELVEIIKFFEYWWAKFATPQSPKIAVMPVFRDLNVLHRQLDFNLKFLKKWGLKKTVHDIFASNLYTGYQRVYDEAIPAKYIQIVDVPTKEALSMRLSRLKDIFHHTNLVLKEHHTTVKNMQVSTQERTR